MANEIKFETRMAKRMQVLMAYQQVYSLFVNVEQNALFKHGDKVDIPYQGIVRVQNVTSRSADLNMPDIKEGIDQLHINTIKAAPFGVSGFDDLQSNFNQISIWSDQATTYLVKAVDGDVLSEVANASNVIDDATFGGVSGDPISLDTSNVLQVFTRINNKLQNRGISITGEDQRFEMKARKIAGYGGGKGFFIMNPFFNQMMLDSLGERETNDGDRIGQNGYVGKRLNLDLAVSNHTYWTGVFGLATNPTNGDIIIIGGVTITFVSSIGTTAGNVLIGANVDETRANLETLLNTPSTTTSTGVAFSDVRPSIYERSDSEIIKDVTATNDDTANTLTIASKSNDYLVVSSNLTDGTDGWSKETAHLLAGRKGCVQMVTLIEPKIEVSSVPLKLNYKYIKPYTFYGKKMTTAGSLASVDIKINTANL